jgi:lysozyme family protein
LRFLRALSVEELKKYSIFVGENVDEDDIRRLTEAQAKALYKGEFWDHASFEKLPNQNLANYLFDMAINMGISPAIKCLQRACWAVKKDRNILHDDGIMGPLTLSMAHECGFYLLPVLRAERAGLYRVITEQHPPQREFLDGWLNRTYSQ